MVVVCIARRIRWWPFPTPDLWEGPGAYVPSGVDVPAPGTEISVAGLGRGRPKKPLPFRWLSIPLEHGMWGGVALDELLLGAGVGPSGGVAEAYETARIAASDPHQERDARLTLMWATGRFRSVREDRDWIPPVYAAVRDMTKSAVSSAVRAAAIATIRVYAEALADLDADSHARGEYFLSDRGGGVMGVHAALTYESTIDALGAPEYYRYSRTASVDGWVSPMISCSPRSGALWTRHWNVLRSTAREPSPWGLTPRI